MKIQLTEIIAILFIKFAIEYVNVDNSPNRWNVIMACKKWKVPFSKNSCHGISLITVVPSPAKYFKIIGNSNVVNHPNESRKPTDEIYIINVNLSYLMFLLEVLFRIGEPSLCFFSDSLTFGRIVSLL